MALAMRVFSFNHIEVRNPLTALSNITAIYVSSKGDNPIIKVTAFLSYQKDCLLSIFVMIFLFLFSLSICSFELVGYIISCGICWQTQKTHFLLWWGSSQTTWPFLHPAEWLTLKAYFGRNRTFRVRQVPRSSASSMVSTSIGHRSPEYLEFRVIW